MPKGIQTRADHLKEKSGIFLMGGGAVAVLLYSRGKSDLPILMYSINVFLTFTLTELGMSRYWIRTRKDPEHKRWLRNLAIHGTGLSMCLSILIVSVSPLRLVTVSNPMKPWGTAASTSSFLPQRMPAGRAWARTALRSRRVNRPWTTARSRPPGCATSS